MDRSLIEKYKNDMLKMSKRSIATAAAAPTDSEQQGVYDVSVTGTKPESYDESGRLTAMATSVGGIYPVPGARVTVFTGPLSQMTDIDSDITDQSGKTKTFELYAPPRGLSEQPGSAQLPYMLYNIRVEKNGFLKNIHLNIPVFRGVTSLQRSDMLPIAVAGTRSEPIIYNEYSSFEL